MARANSPDALIAADTNFLLDLAEGKEQVLDSFEVIRKRLQRGRLLISPTVFQELTYLADQGDTLKERGLASTALLNLGVWKIDLVNLVPVGHGIVERIADKLIDANLLPVEEHNDSLILAEAALLGCAILLTSDAHLRGIDFQKALHVLNAFDLNMPVIATPREIVTKFF